MNKENNNSCHECGVYVSMSKYQKAKLCDSCTTDKRSGNAEVRQIFKDLQAKATNEVEDWGSQNITTKDNALYRFR